MKKIIPKIGHIYEIDLIRVITAFTVVLIHVISTTTYLQPNATGQLIQTLIYHSFHFTREMFMFVTSLVLVYVYYKKSYSVINYWAKRVGAVIIPYVLWTLIYVKFGTNYVGWDYLKNLGSDLLTGNASFQLYYIVLTIQFYIAFPFFLSLFKKVAKHPWIVLSISFALQLIIYYLDFHYLENPALTQNSQFWSAISSYQDRLFLSYEFFFILGAYTAIYFDNIKEFLLKYGKFLLIIYPVSLIVFCLHFISQVNVSHESLYYATSFLQPIIAVYGFVVIAFLGWLVLLWGKRKPSPRGFNIVIILAAITYGIYLVHPLFISLSLNFILPNLFNTSVFLKSSAAYIITMLGSIILCIVLLYTPLLGWSIGKELETPQKLLKKAMFHIKRVNLNKNLKLKIFVLILAITLIPTIFTLQLISPKSASAMTHRVRLSSIDTNFNNISIYNSPLINADGCNEKSPFLPGSTNSVNISVNNLSRSYLIYVPKDFNNSKWIPLILNFHGYRANAIKQEALSGMDNTSNKYNFVSVYPNGELNPKGFRGWNTGLHPYNDANDILFVSDMLTQIQDNLCINPYEIYATGFSNGGGFVNLLACNLSGRIAAFAPVSGSYVTAWDKCKPTRSVPIIEFHGLGDQTVPFMGNSLRHEPSVLNWAMHWALIDKCSDPPARYKIADNVDGTLWKECDNNSEVLEFAIEDLNHQWPQLPIALNSKSKKYINEIMWDFFNNHKLNPINVLNNNETNSTQNDNSV